MNKVPAGREDWSCARARARTSRSCERACASVLLGRNSTKGSVDPWHVKSSSFFLLAWDRNPKHAMVDARGIEYE